MSMWYRLTFLEVEPGREINIGVDDVNNLPKVIELFLKDGIVMTGLEMVGKESA